MPLHSEYPEQKRSLLRAGMGCLAFAVVSVVLWALAIVLSNGLNRILP